MRKNALTAEQFAAIVELTGMHKASATAAALRSVFVDGSRQVDAAALHGIAAGSLYRRAMELRRKIALARIVADARYSFAERLAALGLQ